MTPRQLREWLYLSLYDELSEHEEHLLQEYLAKDETARDEYDQLKKLHQTLEKEDRKTLSDKTLWEARQGLQAVLRYEQASRSFWQRVTDTLTIWKDLIPMEWIPRYRVVFGGGAIFALGLFLGSQGLFTGTLPEGDVIRGGLSEADLLSRSDVEISNVRFMDPDVSDGGVEFVFEAIRPIHMKGPLSDPRIQKVLAYAVVNEQNPGVRLRAVNAVGAFRQPSADNEIKHALITALKSDPNDGVRGEALNALIQYPFDRAVKSALLHVLTHDTNAALRIEAINRLESRADEETQADPALVDVLRSKMETDENSYIRLRARTVLDELSNP